EPARQARMIEFAQHRRASRALGLARQPPKHAAPRTHQARVVDPRGSIADADRVVDELAIESIATVEQRIAGTARAALGARGDLSCTSSTDHRYLVGCHDITKLDCRRTRASTTPAALRSK